MVGFIFEIKIELNRFLTYVVCHHILSVRPNFNFMTEPQVIARQCDGNLLSMAMECNCF